LGTFVQEATKLSLQLTVVVGARSDGVLFMFKVETG